ncbi:MAG: hypothetical protein QXM43_00975, partial [Desulfurococcaceae archaeon]
MFSSSSMALYLDKENSIVGVVGFVLVVAWAGIGGYYRTTVPGGFAGYGGGLVYIRKAEGWAAWLGARS